MILHQTPPPLPQPTWRCLPSLLVPMRRNYSSLNPYKEHHWFHLTHKELSHMGGRCRQQENFSNLQIHFRRRFRQPITSTFTLAPRKAPCLSRRSSKSSCSFVFEHRSNSTGNSVKSSLTSSPPATLRFCNKFNKPNPLKYSKYCQINIARTKWHSCKKIYIVCAPLYWIYPKKDAVNGKCKAEITPKNWNNTSLIIQPLNLCPPTNTLSKSASEIEILHDIKV